MLNYSIIQEVFWFYSGNLLTVLNTYFLFGYFGWSSVCFLYFTLIGMDLCFVCTRRKKWIIILWFCFGILLMIWLFRKFQGFASIKVLSPLIPHTCKIIFFKPLYGCSQILTCNLFHGLSLVSMWFSFFGVTKSDDFFFFDKWEYCITKIC